MFVCLFFNLYYLYF